MVEQLKTIKDQLIAQVQAQMGDLKCVDAKELGEVVDMIKDLAEAVYYCEIYDQMKSSEERRKEEMVNNYYYTEYSHPYNYERDMDRSYGRMYYSSNSGTGTSSSHMGANSGSTSSSSNSMGEACRSYYTE